MRSNLGYTDRLVRIVMAFAFSAVFARQFVTGTIAWIFLGLAGMLFLTSIAGFCPLYKLFGISTLRRNRTR